MTLQIVDQDETRTTWSSPGGGTTTESTSFVVEHDAGEFPQTRDVERLVSDRLADGNGYVGGDLRVNRSESNVKVYGLAEGREATRYTVTVDKEW